MKQKTDRTPQCQATGKILMELLQTGPEKSSSTPVEDIVQPQKLEQLCSGNGIITSWLGISRQHYMVRIIIEFS